MLEGSSSHLLWASKRQPCCWEESVCPDWTGQPGVTLCPLVPLQNSASELRGCFLGLSLQYVHQRKQNGQLLGCALFSINTLCLEPRHFFSSLLLRKLSIVSHIPDLLYSCYYFITLDICFILHGCLLTVILLGKRILFYFLASKNSSQI